MTRQRARLAHLIHPRDDTPLGWSIGNALLVAFLAAAAVRQIFIWRSGWPSGIRFLAYPWAALFVAMAVFAAHRAWTSAPRRNASGRRESGYTVAASLAEEDQRMTAQRYVLGEFVREDGEDVILLKLLSAEAVVWLQDIVRGMQTKDSASLLDMSGIDVPGVERLDLARVEGQTPARLLRVGRETRFTWSCTADQWETVAQLLDPFLEGTSTGFQYLTNGAADDAVVVVSMGEALRPPSP